MKIALLFVLMALMRVIQSVCGKKSSNELVNIRRFFLYCIYYMFLATAFSVITLAITGFSGFQVGAVVCGLVTAAFLAINLYAGLNSIRGCKIIVNQMFGFGGMIVSCILSWVWFGEKMGAFQFLGLGLFFMAAFLLSSKEKDSEGKVYGKISGKTFFLLFLFLFSEGFVEVSQKYFSLKIVDCNVAWYSFFMFAFSTIFMAITFFVLQIGHKAKFRTLEHQEVQNEETIKLNKLLYICGLLLAFAVFVVNYAVAELGKTVPSAVLFSIMATITLFITAIVGYIVYKEKLSIKNLIGLGIGLASIIILTI